MSTGYLALEDGTIFPGRSVAAPGVAFGEAVFTTAMTGYQETVTDPSFAGQLVAFTAPMIGNYGVAEARLESPQPWVKAVLMRRCGGAAWAGWLASHGIVALEDIDTRKLVLRIREAGSMRAAVVADGATSSAAATVELIREQPSMEGQALVSAVSSVEPAVFNDRGARARGGRRLRRQDLDHAPAARRRSRGDRLPTRGRLRTSSPGSTVSSSRTGPGDPEPLVAEVEAIRGLLGRTSVLGICLGHQLLGLATGHATYKLPFGHRGANHPVLERATGRVLVTSQNHGFAVAADRRPGGDLRLALRRHRRGFRLSRSSTPAPCSSIRRQGPGTHDAWPILEGWVDGLVPA